MTLREQAQKSKYLVTGLADILFPARCASCSGAVAQQGALCGECWGKMRFITDPLCHCCGLPFEYVLGENALCGDCIREMPPFRHARALFRYDDASRAAVLALKYADKTQLAPVFGSWLARAASDYRDKAQFIIPVPLHWRRLWKRRYNQSALLAHALSAHLQLPVLADALIRTRATPIQGGLSRKGRMDNVRGAFSIHPRNRASLKDVSVLLIDDVMTTGATLAACSRMLHDAGVRDVYALTLARTLLDDSFQDAA